MRSNWSWDSFGKFSLIWLLDFFQIDKAQVRCKQAWICTTYLAKTIFSQIYLNAISIYAEALSA